MFKSKKTTGHICYTSCSFISFKRNLYFTLNGNKENIFLNDKPYDSTSYISNKYIHRTYIRVHTYVSATYTLSHWHQPFIYYSTKLLMSTSLDSARAKISITACKTLITVSLCLFNLLHAYLYRNLCTNFLQRAWFYIYL